MFKGGVYFKVGREIKNCINYGIINFRITPPLLTTSAFDYIMAATLIRGGAYFKPSFFQMRRLFRGQCLFKKIRCEDSCTNCPKYLSHNLPLWSKRYKVVNVLNEIFYTARHSKM